MKNNLQKIWKLLKNFLSLQCQNVCFDYPGRIPRSLDLCSSTTGARHHDNYSTFKTIPLKGVVLSFIELLKSE